MMEQWGLLIKKLNVKNENYLHLEKNINVDMVFIFGVVTKWPFGFEAIM